MFENLTTTVKKKNSGTTLKIPRLPANVTVQQLFDVTEAQALFDEIYKLTWQRHQIKMYGQTIPAPREFAWMGLSPSKGLYGHIFTGLEWADPILTIRNQIEEITGVCFDSCNINMYRSESDHLGWHIDPEDEGLWKFPIASISLGAERKFEMREYTRVNGTGKKLTNRSDIYMTDLKPGSLLVMPPNFQATHLHRLPKMSRPCGERINLTFRRILDDESRQG